MESLNLKMAPWEKLRQRFTEVHPDLIDLYETIFFDKKTYENYWNIQKNKIVQLNQNYGFQLKFFFPPFDSYFENQYREENPEKNQKALKPKFSCRFNYLCKKNGIL